MERNTITNKDDVFELVEEFPLGYHIWNIGKNMRDGYLPLCRLRFFQPFPGAQEIEPDTLKAIKSDGAQVILAAIGYGPETPKEMEQYIAKHDKDPSHIWIVQRMEKALPFMREIKWASQ